MSDIQEKRNLILITGGARSGKSELAESIAVRSGLAVYYLATMEHWVDDPEINERILRHKERRPNSWKTIEAHLDLKGAIKLIEEEKACVVIDCLSLFVSNLLLVSAKSADAPYQDVGEIMARVDDLLAAIETCPQFEFVVVTNEVGWGVVPDTPLGRVYRDLLGLTNQSFARKADIVWLVCAGLKIQLK